MAGSEDDPVLLFTPPRQSQAVLEPSSEPPSFPQHHRHRRSQEFHIAVPSLSLSDKKKYKELSKSSLTRDVEISLEDLEQVVGEYREKTSLYYFARFRDGNVHKVRAF
jgi:hypothetical protein